MTTQAEAIQALDASQRCLDTALAVAQSRHAEIASQIQPAQARLSTINSARTALQGNAVPADLPALITAGVQASADGLQQANNLLNAAAAVALTAGALDEWKECRNTIDRCDKLLVDLRKTGFGFITAVVGAAAYVFATKQDHTGNLLKSDLLCALVVLIVVLYLIDLAHQSWLVLAVKRAETLEKRLNFELTQMISQQFAASRSTFLGAALYLLLLTASCVIFWASIPSGEGPYSAPRGNIYAAFAVGIYVIVTAPWFSEWLTVGYAQLSRRTWWLLCGVTAFFVGLGLLEDLFGPLNGVFHRLNLTYPKSFFFPF